MKYLHRWLTTQADSDLSDRQLLENCAGQHDEAAFALLVKRYGPMVWRMSRRWLSDVHEAEDAFQATFLVLAHRDGPAAGRGHGQTTLRLLRAYGPGHGGGISARRQDPGLGE
jgi:hypothetical protein